MTTIPQENLAWEEKNIHNLIHTQRNLIFMNDPQKEITKLHEQVSQLYMVVKQLSEYVGWDDVSNFHSSLESSSIRKFAQSHSHKSKENKKSSENLHLLNQHKDILIDDELVRTSVLDNKTQHAEAISCEEQVHRLTAQLTAAYYRIASLEEQLLAIRNHVEVGDNSFYQCQ